MRTVWQGGGLYGHTLKWFRCMKLAQYEMFAKGKIQSMWEYVVLILSHPLSHTSLVLTLFGYPKLPTILLTVTLMWSRTMSYYF